MGHSPTPTLRRTTAAAVAILAVAASIPPTGAAAGDTVLARELRPTAVSAFGGVVVWSSWNRRDDRYRLVAWDPRRGRRVLPAAPRRVPFDADLGPDRRGRPTAVYSRCRKEPTLAFSRTELPIYVIGRGCDLYQVDIGAGGERRIDKLSQRGANEVLPAIWRAGVAFARVYTRRPGLRGVLPHLLLGSLRSSGRSRKLPAGTRGVYENLDLGGPGPAERAYWGGPGPVGIDFDGHRVAFVWDGQAESCRAGDEGDLDHLRSEVRIDTVDGGHELVEYTCEGETDFFFSPALTSDRLFYSRRLQDTSFNGRFRAYDFDGAAFSETPASRKSVSIAREGDTTYFARFLDLGGRTEIVRSTDLVFDPAARVPTR